MTSRCKRCLLSEAGQIRAAQTIAELIALLPEEKRTPAAEYAARLESCRVCEALNAGTCGRCGCYVELRAAKAWMNCPHIQPRW